MKAPGLLLTTAALLLLAGSGCGSDLACSPAASAALPGEPATRQDEAPSPSRPGAAPGDPAAPRPSVRLFVLHDCPICNAYAPEIRRLRAQYEPAGVAFVLVHVDPDLGEEAARDHAAEYGHDVPVLIDPHHDLARSSGVTKVPAAAVIDAAGRLVYSGRIDDLYADYGRRRTAPTERSLAAALDALLAGRPVPAAGGPPVGCPLPDLAPETPSDAR